MLNRIQKQFVRLAIIHKTNWLSIGGRMPRRRRIGKYSPSEKLVKVIIINAVTGEKTTAKSYDDSAIKLKKWLKLRNVRAQFAAMLIKKKSTWAQLSEEEFKDYPIIVKIGTYQAPYLIDHIGDKLTIGNKTTATLFLKTVDNINYLSIIDQKKALLPKSPIKIVKRKTKKKKS